MGYHSCPHGKSKLPHVWNMYIGSAPPASHLEWTQALPFLERSVAPVYAEARQSEVAKMKPWRRANLWQLTSLHERPRVRIASTTKKYKIQSSRRGPRGVNGVNHGGACSGKGNPAWSYGLDLDFDLFRRPGTSDPTISPPTSAPRALRTRYWPSRHIDVPLTALITHTALRMQIPSHGHLCREMNTHLRVELGRAKQQRRRIIHLSNPPTEIVPRVRKHNGDGCTPPFW